jgi:hypothetical protein
MSVPSFTPLQQAGNHVGFKFDADGGVLRYPGNTIICHVPLFSPLSDALVAVRDQLKASEFGSYLAFLPPESYHMTVFEGATHAQRKAGFWPADLAPDAPLGACTHHFEQALMNFDPACEMPLRMKVADGPAQPDIGSMKLIPVDDAENRKLRGLRDRLSSCLSIRRPDHDQYVFHITLAYHVKPMTHAQAHACQQFQAESFAWLAQAASTIELGAPEFCVFNDMYAFDNQFYLGGSPALRRPDPARTGGRS